MCKIINHINSVTVLLFVLLNNFVSRNEQLHQSQRYIIIHQRLHGYRMFHWIFYHLRFVAIIVVGFFAAKNHTAKFKIQ